MISNRVGRRRGGNERRATSRVSVMGASYQEKTSEVIPRKKDTLKVFLAQGEEILDLSLWGSHEMASKTLSRQSTYQELAAQE